MLPPESRRQHALASRTPDIEPRTDNPRHRNGAWIYIDGVQHLDNIPRPSDYVKTLKPIRRDAGKLLNAVANLSGYMRDQIELQGGKVDSILSSLTVALRHVGGRY